LQDGKLSPYGSGNLYFQTSGTSRLSVLNNGNVGIGTTSPSTKLHVAGDVYLHSGSSYRIGSYSDSGNRLRLHHNGSAAYIDYQPNLYIRSGGMVNVLKLSSNGTVDVFGNISAASVISNENIQVGNGPSGLNAPMGYGKMLLFGDYGENYDQMYLSRYNVTQDQSELRVNLGDDNNDKFVVGNHFLGAPDFRYMFTVVTNGNVGIGTENPQNKLDVNGTIRAKEVKLETVNWPDYVFDLSYALPNLKEVEAHIREHNRLPGIPSQAEVTAEGVNVGEMNAKLLQKIEELTLYMIGLNEEVESLRKKNEELERKINDPRSF
jgi:hypothetical protein